MPITVAAGAAAVAGLFLAIVLGIVQPANAQTATNLILGFVLLLGIGVFLFAMWWDASDRARVTRRSDVAFWLHLLAAPMIAHPIFTLMGLNNGVVGTGEALVVVGLYVLFGLTALAIDRRALLVSALAYVLFALTELFKRFGAVELNVALTALVIGSALLLLSAYWHQARRLVVTPPAVEPSGAAAEPRPSGGCYPTSRIRRRSSGASTGASSWPRFSRMPCSPTKANAPCFRRSAGRFSMQISGRSEWRR